MPGGKQEQLQTLIMDGNYSLILSTVILNKMSMKQLGNSNLPDNWSIEGHSIKNNATDVGGTIYQEELAGNGKRLQCAPYLPSLELEERRYR